MAYVCFVPSWTVRANLEDRIEILVTRVKWYMPPRYDLKTQLIFDLDIRALIIASRTNLELGLRFTKVGTGAIF